MSLPPSEPGRASVSVSDAIATVSFFHPKGNSLPSTLLSSLAEMVTALGDDPSVRVVVMQSEGGGAFCGGASFDELRSISDRDTGTDFFMGFARVILAMTRCPKVIMARIHGKAVGGGVGLVAAADYTIAHMSASIRLSELAIGIGPFVVGPCIEWKIGHGAFAGLATDAGWRDAHWAHQRGLYTVLCDTHEKLDETTHRMAATLAASNPEALTRLKRIFWEGTEHWEHLLPRRAEMSGELVLSDFTRDAIAQRG